MGSQNTPNPEPQPPTPVAEEMRAVEEVKVRKLTSEEVAELLKEIERNPERYKEEAKYILFLTLSSYTSNWYRDVEMFEIVDGDAEVVELEFREVCRRVIERYAIIPITVPTVVKVEKSCNYCDNGRSITYYIFNGKKWIAVDYAGGVYGDL